MAALKTVRAAEKTKPSKVSSEIETYTSVWDAISDTPEQAANLQVRTALVRQIAAIVVSARWTQAQAASRSGVTLLRMNDLLGGCVSRFSLDALVNIAMALGQKVHVELHAA
jgi:predicted XRE-type DNA-binding protein